MRQFISLLLISILIYFSWPYLTDHKDFQNIKAEIENLKENPELVSALEKFNSGLNQLLWQVKEKKRRMGTR